MQHVCMYVCIYAYIEIAFFVKRELIDMDLYGWCRHNSKSIYQEKYLSWFGHNDIGAL